MKTNRINVLLKSWLPSIIVAVVVFCVLGYRHDYLLIENSEAYRIFTQSKTAYEKYEKEHGEKPANLSFLPSFIRIQVNQDGYPLQYNTNNYTLTCEIRSPLGTVPNLHNYLWPPTPPIEMTVGKLLPK